jgi:hypothetical protein
MIAVPVNGASLTSPAQFQFSIANPPPAYDHMELQADGTTLFYTGQKDLTGVYVFLPSGQHEMTLIAYENNKNQIGQSNIAVTISEPANPQAINNIQDILGWTWCTASLNGGPCASGLGNATSVMMEGQKAPSLSGNSALFTIGGNTPYSNALWWKSLGGGVPLNHLTYSIDFYIDDASRPEALEFDVNQSYEGVRYTWGTECSYKYTRKWDIWNPETLQWVRTKVPCPQVTSKAWHHLRWGFERVNGQVHYIDVTLDNITTPVDVLFNPQTNWTRGEDIDLAFQMDGDFHQEPYKVWLDNVSLAGSY